MTSIMNSILMLLTGTVAGERQKGATLIEYVLIVAVIAVGIFVAASTGLGAAITSLFTEASNQISQS